MKIYTASKTIHAEKWRNLRASGVNVISTWIDEAGPGESASLMDLWIRCVKESSEADLLIAYRAPGEILKGALVEIGCALASGKRVWFAGDSEGYSFTNHHLVTKFKTLVDMLKALRRVTEVTAEVNR